MSGRVDDALTVLRQYGSWTEQSDAVDVLAGELELLRANEIAWSKTAHTASRNSGKRRRRAEKAERERDALAVQVEQLKEALRGIAESMPRPVLDPHNCEERLRKAARAALEAGSTTPAVSAGNEQ